MAALTKRQLHGRINDAAAEVAAWKNLSAEEQNDLAGQMTSADFRNGPVLVSIRPDAPSAVVEAFNAEVDPVATHYPEGGTADPVGAELADAYPVIDGLEGDVDANARLAVEGVDHTTTIEVPHDR